jgi:hypothetical protein
LGLELGHFLQLLRILGTSDGVPLPALCAVVVWAGKNVPVFFCGWLMFGVRKE